jgi:hypothetical protein
VIPFSQADGSPTGYVRLKPDRPRRDRKGRPVKYESPRGQPNRGYLPPGCTPAAAADPRLRLLVTEGEKQAAKAGQEGFPCVGLVGVYGWQKKRPKGPDGKGAGPRQLTPDLAAAPWQGRPVYVAFDSDAAGNDKVRWAEWHLAEALRGQGADVRVVRLPGGKAADGGPAKAGLDDYLVAHGPDALESLLAQAGPPGRPGKPGGGAAKGMPAKSPASAALAGPAEDARVELWRAPDQAGYATAPLGGCRPNVRLRSAEFRNWLAHRYPLAHRRVPTGQALADAAAVLEGRAQYGGGEEFEARVRVAGRGGRVFLDLADAGWHAVEVAPAGWRVVRDPPVKFRRPRGMPPLPHPARGGPVDEPRPLLNVAADDDWRVLVAWLVGALRPAGPYPLLCLLGEQGSAKSTTARLLRGLIDPYKAQSRAAPANEGDLMIAAGNGHVLSYDNLSAVKGWLSDALRRPSTGGGYTTRALYTDGDEVILDAVRPVILNGITDVVTRPDLLQRAVVVRHPGIGKARRRTEQEVNDDFAGVRPRVLGALLDAVAGALGAYPGTRLRPLPRMADFARFVTAAGGALGWPAGAFMRAYEANLDEGHEVALEDAAAVPYLRRLLRDKVRWRGSAPELLQVLSGMAGEQVTKGPDWPRRHNKLAGDLRRLAPSRRGVGVGVAFEREPGGERRRYVRLDPPDHGGPQERPPAGSSRSSRGAGPGENGRENQLGAGRRRDDPGPGRDDGGTTPGAADPPDGAIRDDRDDARAAPSAAAPVGGGDGWEEVG